MNIDEQSTTTKKRGRKPLYGRRMLPTMVQLSPDNKIALKLISAHTGKPMQRLLNEIIQEYVKQQAV